MKINVEKCKNFEKQVTKNMIFFINSVNSLLCCIKLSIIVQRNYINVLTKRLSKQSMGTYNDLANFQKSCFLLLFFKVDLSLYEFPCFVFLVIWGEGPCNFIIQSCLILCNTTKNWQKSQSRYFEQFRAISRLFGANSVLVSIFSEFAY